jgi:hypothetical protein
MESSKLVTDMKITNIIGNPPFDGKNQLHIKFLKDACGTAERVVFVQPASWLYNQRPGSKFDKTKQSFIDDNIKISQILFFNGNPVFKIKLWTPLAVITIDNNKTDNLISVEQIHWTGEEKTTYNVTLENLNPFMDGRIELFDDIQNKISNAAGVSNIDENVKATTVNDFNVPISYVIGNVHQKANKMYKEDFYTFRTNEDLDSDGLMTKADIDKYNEYNKETGVCRAASKVMPHFDTREEAVNFSKYLKSYFAVFCLMMYKDSQNIHCGGILKYVPMMPDYTQEWTDDRIYQHMGFNQEEITYIKEMVNRWKNS